MLFTEAGTKRRASLYVVATRGAMLEHDPGGLEVLDADFGEFEAALVENNHTIKRALTDPSILSGVGNAYSDEILFEARMSPYKQTQKMIEDELRTVFEASKKVLSEWRERLIDELDGKFPDKVTAFRPEMNVHGKYGEPCSVIGGRMTWEDAWSEGRTGWDAGKGAPPLVELIESGRLPKGRAFVPGCGSGYDVFNLAEAGWEVDGLDIAPTAVGRFRALREERGISPEKARITNADFFEFQAEPYDLIFDYTFLCAIELERRHEWARKTESLLAEDGLLITLVFPMGDDFEYEEGPPYRLSPDLVRGVALPYFTCVDVFRPSQSHEGREGREVVALWKRRVSD